MNEEEYFYQPEPKPLERNQVTWEKHRRDVRLQILLPTVIGAVIVILLAVSVTLGTNAQVSQGADVALIWIIAPMLLVTLIFLVVLGFVTYGVIRLVQVLPFYSKQVQDAFLLVRDRVSEITDRLVEPVLSLQSKKARYGAFWRTLWGK